MMVGDRGAQVLDWLAGWLAWLGEQAEELGRQELEWLNSLEPAYRLALGAGCILFGVLVLVWYSSRR